MFWLITTILSANAEPTELEKERQKLIDMGIDPAVLDELVASAEQTHELQVLAKQIDERVRALQQAVAARPALAACESGAKTRAGKPVTGSITWTVTFAPTGAVSDVTEVRRDAAVDDPLAACAVAVIRGLDLLGAGITPPVPPLELTLTFPYAAPK